MDRKTVDQLIEEAKEKVDEDTKERFKNYKKLLDQIPQIEENLIRHKNDRFDEKLNGNLIFIDIQMYVMIVASEQILIKTLKKQLSEYERDPFNLDLIIQTYENSRDHIIQNLKDLMNSLDMMDTGFLFHFNDALNNYIAVFEIVANLPMISVIYPVILNDLEYFKKYSNIVSNTANNTTGVCLKCNKLKNKFL